MKLLFEQHSTAKELVELTKEAFGDRSDEFSDALYLLAKTQLALGESESSLDLIRQAIRIEINKPRSGTKKDFNIAMMYLMKASLL